jgi:hypothetical protein
MRKYSQFNAPLASTPGGPNNIELNGEAAEFGGESAEGVTPEEMVKVLNKIVQQNDFQGQSKELMVSELEDLLLRLKDQEIKTKISTIINALNMASDPRKQTIDPETGKKDPGPKELAQSLLKIVNSKVPSQNQNMENTQPTENTMASVYNHRTAQKVIKKKKKTRGNPFRVLMGKVGKLLDHGVSKSDIVRYIAKEDKWSTETIDKAVKIVMDYNRKKHQKESSNDSRVVTAAYDYTTKPDFEKRSTPELVFRVCYLLDLDDYSKSTKQGHGNDADSKKGVKEEISQIRQALQNRGMSKEEMDKLGFGK